MIYNNRQNASLQSVLSLSRNEFDVFNNIGARMLVSIYQMTLNLIKNGLFGLKINILSYVTQRYNRRHFVTPLIC